MAELVEFPGQEGPVNDGERRVVKAFLEALPDDFEVYPALQVLHRGRIDDIDVLVLTRDLVCLVEVKDLAGDVVVGEREFLVDGEHRAHPYISVMGKAKRLKSRLQAADRDLSRVWVTGLVVLARPPRSLDRAPELRDKVVDVATAVELLREPDRLGAVGGPLGEKAARIRSQLHLVVTPRRARPVYGPYRVVETLAESDDEFEAIAEHGLTGREARIRVIRIPAFAESAQAQRRRTQAAREARALQVLGHFPSITGAREAQQLDDGSVLVVSDPPSGPTLADGMARGRSRRTNAGACSAPSSQPSTTRTVTGSCTAGSGRR